MKKEDKAFYTFFGISVILLIVVIGISATLELIFKSPDIELESFNFSMHNILEFDDAYRGTKPDADITLAMFMDFKCTACIEQYPIIKRIMINYSNEVNFLFKHLTNANDEEALFGARAFECAKLQNKGYNLADYMFTSVFNEGEVLEQAEMIDIDMDQFSECINSTEITSMILADNNHAAFLKVKGSPTIFLNGIKIEGAHSYEVFEELIKKEIEDKREGKEDGK